MPNKLLILRNRLRDKTERNAIGEKYRSLRLIQTQCSVKTVEFVKNKESPPFNSIFKSCILIIANMRHVICDTFYSTVAFYLQKDLTNS